MVSQGRVGDRTRVEVAELIQRRAHQRTADAPEPDRECALKAGRALRERHYYSVEEDSIYGAAIPTC